MSGCFNADVDATSVSSANFPNGALICLHIDAPFGKFALDTLVASTAALKQPDTAAGNLKYDQVETQIANLTAQRNLVAGNIRAALNDAAKGSGKLDEGTAKDWINQGQGLLDAAAALAAAS